MFRLDTQETVLSKREKETLGDTPETHLLIYHVIVNRLYLETNPPP